MIRKVDHLVITTGDMERCLSFYEKIGFRVEREAHRCQVFGGDFKINIHLIGQELHPHARNVQIGSGDFCFELKEPIGVFQTFLMAQGVLAEGDIVSRRGAFGRMQSIYLRDPDGNLLEFSSYLDR